MRDRDTLARQVAIRLSQSDIDRLEAMAARIPVASRNAIARVALRLGLDALEENPGRILRRFPTERRRKESR